MPAFVCAVAVAIAQLVDVLVSLVDMLHAPACAGSRVAVRVPSGYKAPPGCYEVRIIDTGVHTQLKV